MNSDKVIDLTTETTQTTGLDASDSKPLSVSSYELPPSSFLSVETRKALKQSEINYKDYAQKIAQSCPSLEQASEDAIPAIRQRQAELFYSSPLYTNMTNRYKVAMTPETIAGVYTEVFTPAEGVPTRNQKQVLINLHGGGFTSGARTMSHLESIPIAAIGKVKVISIDYRMAPEHQFPAASEDVVAVYKALLQDYQPENIGIYGCSAGAILTAQSIACLQQQGVPLPGAVGMSCAAAYYWSEGDSGYTVASMVAFPIEGPEKHSYFGTLNPDNIEQVFPGKSTKALAKFPASLLMSSTRDYALSSVVHTHAQLNRLGVEASLHVWEGLDHAFLYDPELPESREAYSVIVNFFDKHLDKF